MAHLGANLVRHFRSQRRDVRLEQSFHDQLDESSHAIGQAVIDPRSNPSEKALRRERAVVVANALDGLPAHQREVVVLHEFEGCTIPEIANRLGRSANSVQKLWARALIQLHQRMKYQL
jgi:RNA polymerase sigma-70 factor (ECF subfamily)